MREYHWNPWTDTLHVDPKCKGLRASQAPIQKLRLSDEEVFGRKMCGFCGRVSEESLLSRAV